MNWLVDHAIYIYIVLGIALVGIFTAWWRDQRVRYLLYVAAGVIVLVGLFWGLTQVVVTDKQQIRRNLDEMADAVLAQNVDALFKHVAADFTYKHMNRKQMYDAVSFAIK